VVCYELRLFFFTSGDRRPAASLSTPRWPDGGETTQPQQPRRGFISSTDQLGHGATTFDGPLVSSIPAIRIWMGQTGSGGSRARTGRRGRRAVRGRKEVGPVLRVCEFAFIQSVSEAM
jgi:hypothetical protein